jgi:AraC-like DNA-binding protein
LCHRRLPLLLSTKADNGNTLETIVFDSGFNNRQTFARMFKQQYGMSPKSYRGEIRGSEGLSGKIRFIKNIPVSL